MITPDMIQRINELAHKQKETALSPAEQDEQNNLRRLYIDQIKANVRVQIEASLAQPAQKASKNSTSVIK
ncbi:uncharacterized protein YnzC (UPF0291/DUF896 family) [Sporomusaceae bacterium BoRhaA]|uniref:DUF896 domain-containing protein n=1 Tax=Pelorhabdus rhamnosifermentans TaxID=2772457 RepID=UPI001C0622B2|nr:DUF896 domain-containing protein [Pelorhabdus rhamnosifermentans]MBU2703448.1 uncharacterized protein YnzC (UPF0291/DUF896 family) [Pelorhabdus rhamnosifermentans]